MAAVILGIVASFVGPVMKIGKCIAEPIKRQCNYLCCFSSNIGDLINESKKLEDARERLQTQVTAAENNAEVILADVMTWLGEAKEAQIKMTGIQTESTKILNVKSRYSLGKKAKKTSDDMKQLRGSCNFNPISYPAPPPAMGSIPLGETLEFESRKHVEEEIMRTLRDNNINMMGICGMGGVGKTTIANRLMKRAREEGLFDEILMVVVSQPVNMLRIQDDIAKDLGLNLGKGSLKSKAHKLRIRLVGRKKILLVLDDVWENIKLWDLGIPCESGLKECKILLTSRDRGVLRAMDVQKSFGIQILTESEAWVLFREKAGTHVDDPRLYPLAEKVAKECKGLLVALIAVARALKDSTDKRIWEDALQQLRSANPTDMPHILDEVYNPLKLSYDFLGSENAKSIFLLCCLFPEDYHIPVEYLAVWAMGLHMFKEIWRLDEARNRTWRLIETLKSRSLLLDGDDEYHVRIHDIIRDVAIFIAEKERHIKCNDCTWFSSFVGERIGQLPIRLNPNLRLLWIDSQAPVELQISNNFFEGIRELNVLFMGRHLSLSSIPHRTQLLKNLHTLFLDSCECVEAISGVGELINLEILICRNCVSIEELPVEIMRLHRLKLLELSNCRRLKRIAPDVISSLVGLEELKIVRSFDKWEAAGRNNACLRELEFLSNLTCLEIEVKDFTLAAEHIHLSSKMVKYDIKIGEFDWNYLQEASLFRRFHEKRVSLNLPREIALGNWIDECVTSAECICIEGEGSHNVENITALLRENTTAKKLLNRTTSSSWGTNTVFPVLKDLVLLNLPNLEEICNIDEGSLDSFKNLERLRLRKLPALKHLWKSPYQNMFVSLSNSLSTIHIWQCHSLQNLFSLATARDCVLQLKRLTISNCEMMEQVFLWNIEEGNVKDFGQEVSRPRITFPKLELLKLNELPRLTAFCKGINNIEFPALTTMDVGKCPRLKNLVCSVSDGYNQNNSGGTVHDHDEDGDNFFNFFCKPEKVTFGSLRNLWVNGSRTRGCNKLIWCRHIPIDFFTGLKRLHIHRCYKIRSLFSYSIAGNFFNLDTLAIHACFEMVKVIEEEKDACGGVLFPRLQTLALVKLRKLETFCGWKYALELPSLKIVEIVDCPQMKRFSLGSLSTPNLKVFRLDTGPYITMKDLNGALRQHLLKVKIPFTWPEVKDPTSEEKTYEFKSINQEETEKKKAEEREEERGEMKVETEKEGGEIEEEKAENVDFSSNN